MFGFRVQFRGSGRKKAKTCGRQGAKARISFCDKLHEQKKHAFHIFLDFTFCCDSSNTGNMLIKIVMVIPIVMY